MLKANVVKMNCFIYNWFCFIKDNLNPGYITSKFKYTQIDPQKNLRLKIEGFIFVIESAAKNIHC